MSEVRWGDVGSDQVPWRTLANQWSTERVKKVRQAVGTPADFRKPQQARLIDEALGVDGKRQRRQDNVAHAGRGTRVRTNKGVRTVR